VLRAVDLIAHKRGGGSHTAGEVRWLVEAFLRQEVPDYQMAAWLMAVCWRGLEASETRALTMALAESGRRLRYPGVGVPVVDKHSTGGVGDKTTLVLAPMLAAAGVAVAKMSGRGLGHTGGTIDKLEAIPGVRTSLGAEEFVRQVAQHHLALAAQSAELAPGDGRLYALRDVTATVESLPLIASSVMSKKIATGADAVVLDVKAGRGAFVQGVAEARALAQTMVALGREVDLPAVAVISSMSRPLGRAIGNALEVQEAVDTLRGQGPPDLLELSLVLGAEVLTACGAAPSVPEARKRLRATISSGEAFGALEGLVSRLGGDPESLTRPGGLPQAPLRFDLPAPRAGYVADVDALDCGRAAMALGAGRARKDEPIDPAVGVVLRAAPGERVERGAPLATLHARESLALDSEPVRRLRGAFAIADRPPPETPLVIETVR
jgi:pyrimidine-nucleoside phosphorylase